MLTPSLRSLALCCLLLLDLSPSPAVHARASVDYNSTGGDEVSWTIRGDADHQLRLIRVASAADVVVTFDSSFQSGGDSAVAKIVAVIGDGDGDIIGEASDLMGVHVESSRDGAIELAIADGVHRPLDKLMVQLAHRGVLQSVAAHGAGSVNIYADVLNDDKDVSLVASSSGDVIVKTDEAITLQSLELISMSSGDVKIESKSSIHVAEAITLAAHASGDVKIHSDTLEAASISVVTHGSGEAYVSGHSRLSFSTISAETAGSGDVTFASSDGQCDNERVTVMSSSDVSTGDVACQSVEVVNLGSGDVVVHAINRLDMSVLSSGSVKYVGDRPAQVTYESSSSRHHSTKPIVRVDRPHEHKEPREVKIHDGDVDVRSPQGHIHIDADGDVDGRSPQGHIHIDADGDDDDDGESIKIWDDDNGNGEYADALSLAKTPEHGVAIESAGIVAVVIVIGVAAVVMVTARRRMSGYETIPMVL